MSNQPKRLSVKRLTAHCFVQGSVEEQNEGECCACDKTVRGPRSWWTGGGGEYDDSWECYCRKHAEQWLIEDEAHNAELAAMTPEQLKRFIGGDNDGGEP